MFGQAVHQCETQSKIQTNAWLHGHIHESNLLRDWAHDLHQPGKQYAEGVLRGCLVTFVDGEVQVTK